MRTNLGSNKNVRRKARKFAQGKKAVAICDRCGFKGLYKDFVIEPGTLLFVDKICNDGRWNRVDHPQNFPATADEAIGLENPRPDIIDKQVPFLETDDGGVLILGYGNEPIYIAETGN